MNHEKYSEMLILFLYEELSEEEGARLTQHLSHCSECREELDGLRKLHKTLEQESPSTSEHLLRQARDKLFLTLRRRVRESGGRRNWKEVLTRLVMPNWLHSNWVAAGSAVTILFLGFSVGYLVKDADQLGALDPYSSVGVRVTNLSLVETGLADGEVQLAFEAVRNFQLQGHIDDQRIQRFLAYALINEQNAGTRLRAVNTIRSQAPITTDRRIQDALVVALRRDENPAVRQQALIALQKYPLEEEIKDVLIYVLMNDQNAKLRIEAINSLEMAHSAGQTLGPEVLETLRQRLQEDDNKYVQLRAKSVLEGVDQRFF